MVAVEHFLQGHRIALVGASEDPKNFAATIGRELVAHGYEVIPVNPKYASVAGSACFSSVGDIPEKVDGALVMVTGDRSAGVVQDCIDAGVRDVWLFKGLGGPGAASDEASARCRAAGVNVVDGACPLMFLEPVGWFHQLHRGIRRVRREVRTT